jgi:hypothetical protein
MITLIANGDPLVERGWSDAARAASLAARRATGSLTLKKAAARAAYGPPRDAGPISRMVRIYRQSKHHAKTAHARGLQSRQDRHPKKRRFAFHTPIL